MLRMNLGALSRTELKQLLAAAEGRGQESLVEQLRAELASRASAGEGRMSASRTPPPAGFDDEPASMVLPDDGASGLWLERDVGRRAPARRWPAGLAAVAAVLVVGGAAAWSLNGAPGLPVGRAAPPPKALAQATAPAPAAASAPTPTPRAMVARVEVTPPAPSEAVAPPTPSPPEPRSQEPPRPQVGTEVRASVPRRLDPCATPPTPADRLLCNDLGLNLLNHEMREAYGRAMDAGADPVAIRQTQAAWRRARDPVSDPRALAQLYDRRIRELKAMAGETPRPDVAATTLERQ
jgi:hypothetical protein